MNQLPEIKDRWSVRAFLSKPIDDLTLQTVITSALSAPSANNSQPWRFILARHSNSLQKMQSILHPSNQVWANQAPVLLLLCANTIFKKSGKKNHYAQFDCGSAWAMLAIEARHQGLYTHAMGGFDRAMAKEIFELDEHIEPQIVIAIGYRGDATLLPEDLQQRENPKPRKSFDELKLDFSDDFGD